MENNEQLTQNPALEEGGENATTTKAPKKAIDGNEKKKIVKLIQPSILPAKVRIEVATLVAETIAETAPVADEVMPEMVDVAEPDEEELKKAYEYLNYIAHIIVKPQLSIIKRFTTMFVNAMY